MAKKSSEKTLAIISKNDIINYENKAPKNIRASL